MSLKKCEQCGEEVDQAKAFCPECGNPFVEEHKREESTEYESYAGTINVTKSMYQQMLSEMELDTSAQPNKTEGEKPINSVKEKADVQTKAENQPKTADMTPKQKMTSQPQPPQQNTVRQTATDTSAPENNVMEWKWVILGMGLLFVFGILALAVFAAAYFYFA